jgi:hypothetical protein
MQPLRLARLQIKTLLRSGPGRVVVSLALALIFQWVYAGWTWDTQLRSGRGLFALSPTGRVVRKEAIMAVVMDRVHEGYFRNQPPLIIDWFLPLAYCIVSALPAACVGLLAFIATTRRPAPRPAHDPESRCRWCTYILKGLSAPICPECGEAI